MMCPGLPPPAPSPDLRPESVEIASRLGAAMKRLHRHISSRVMSGMQEELQGHDLSFSQVTALHQLRAHAPMSVTQLSEHTRLSLPAASHLVERLVRRGLAARQENPDNRREKLLDLTPGGRAVVARLDAGFVDAYIGTFARLDPATLRQAEASILALLAELDAHDTGPPTPDTG